ncbi:carbohydrate binding domain-containing protein [Verrucomicrobiaceae bacterium N1E253]|uniref:Carbohydrate binding domain-containing protein n=1 Tax=Oceaniferula marina TaxID=2748318 RepID=A0A851GM80_9BACT|nr:endo-alpha-N-acetylgalactosaminidase family protein [Oceaniferula marina]NWK55910.1 carbohydrate binding domain-containing protein [Oceaniferula marina]
MRTHFLKSIVFSSSAGFLLSAFPLSAKSETIESDQLNVQIDAAFPRVIDYTWKESKAVLYGQEAALSEVKINGEAHTPKVSFRKMGSDKARYQLDFAKLKLSMSVDLSVAGNVLQWKVSDMDEKGAFKVKSIEFPNHALVSIQSNQSDAALATALTTGNWNKITEEFTTLADKAVDKAPVKQSYAVINTGQLAASIDNNVIQYERVRAQTTASGDQKRYSIWNGVWTYREIDTETLALPWSKVFITADENGDGTVNWQDGAIAYRKNMPEPVGSDDIRSSISYISFNGGSVAIAPFLRALEDAKQLNLMLDGFGQMIQLKGYQSEGHDAAHPDCAGNYNRRAGGLNDLSVFLKHAPKYNIKPGVHINVSESYPEAKNFSDTILRVPYQGGWSWYDSALKMDYRKDILSGSLDARLDQMNEELPGLSWVYVDVYGDHYGNDFWAAHKLGSKLNDNGWMVATEYFGPMERQLLWAHHLYAVPDTKLIRFIKNHVADIFKQHPLLKGAKAFGVGGWENNYNFNKVVDAFFTTNLPTKYMQHFPITRMTDKRIDFEGKVHVEDSNGWKLYRDGVLLSDGYSMFIPWDPVKEDKIYYRSTSTETRTWELPESWKNNKTLKLYQLTRLGRKFVQDLSVVDGKVGILAEPNTPYVLYPAAAPAQNVIWGEGGHVKDPGFSSETFDSWTKQQSEGSTGEAKIVVDAHANAMLSLDSGKSGDAKAVGVSQTISGLKSGTTYTASVWVKVTGGRKASIGVNAPGQKMLSNWVDRTDHVRSEGRLKYKGTTFQRLAVEFDAPKGGGKVNLMLWAEQGDAGSSARFDDVRIIELQGKTDRKNALVFEDFEHVDEQWGPFVAANGTDHTHLSELNPGKTKDTINGNFSLKNLNEGKTGEIYRTLQSTLKLKPNTEYTIRFEYLNENAEGRFIAAKSKDGGEAATTLNKAIPKGKGTFTATFKTGKHSDYYLTLGTDKKSGKLFVIDDFLVKEAQ